MAMNDSEDDLSENIIAYNGIYSANFKKHIKNTAWMLFEQLVRVISVIFVVVYIARYLGPEKFGVLNYAYSIVLVFTTISRFGLDSILVRELACNPQRKNELMGTAFRLILFTSLVCVIIIVSIVELFHFSSEIKLLVLVISIGISCQSFYVIDYYYQSKIMSGFSARSKIAGLFISSIIKIIMVASGSELIMFGFAFALDQVLICVFLLLTYSNNSKSLRSFKFDFDVLVSLLKSAWPMLVTAVATILYMRVDQIMIMHILGERHVGLYSAAIKIYEGWSIFLFVLCTSFLPVMAKQNKNNPTNYESNIVRLFMIVIWSSIILALLISVYSEIAVHYIFGDLYIESAGALKVLMWASIFTGMGYVTSRHLIVRKLEVKVVYRTVIALSLNVVFNYLLIPKYGIIGAAISTLGCLFVANYLLDLTDKQLYHLFKMKNKSITFNLFS